jgi:hypothetical protein
MACINNFKLVSTCLDSLTFGMMEYWNTGILGSGKMEDWVIVKFPLTGIKYRNVIFFELLFQYSIIPLFHVRVKNMSQKHLYFQ